MTARPVPIRIAGYNPAPPVEVGRVPATPLEAPVSTGAPGVRTPVAPPVRPPFVPPFLGPPPFLIPPIIIPPGEPPCDPETDPDCEAPMPPEPPVDVPEPGILILLLTGVGAYWLLGQRRAAQPAMIRVRK
ncbi:MAG: PEP-CTERM sorting domain-containing protein [Alphaproteobacteria bacterium]|nr:PEP-CTERM sorting domain-containing protein [Alphaproteobacteria bacterium]